MKSKFGNRHGGSGFSLVELLVALAFTAILMAGMAQVFQASVRNYNAVNETIGAQRTNRWAMDQISDDISQAGLIFPDRLLPSFLITSSGADPSKPDPSLFSIQPSVTVAGVARVSDTNPATTEPETVKADILQFFADVPLPVTGTWAADTDGDNPNPGGIATSAPASATINFNLGAYTDLKADDVMVILDSGEYGNWEHPLIAGAANPVVWETSGAKVLEYSATPISPGITLAHKKGVPVYFVRPAQLIRYSVQAVALDPANSSVKLPCLVRQQMSYPTSGSITAATWSTATTQILAENVEGFRVDLSFDGGKTWARPTTATPTWADFQSKANTQLAAIGLPGQTSITDPAKPDWFHTINCLIRVDITTRAPLRREEFSNTPGARAYRLRTQTLMISPRNFGVGN